MLHEINFFVFCRMLTAGGGLVHNYPNHTIYSQPQTSFMQNQICYSQPTIHTSQPHNCTAQRLGYQATCQQDIPLQVLPPVQVDPRANV